MEIGILSGARCLVSDLRETRVYYIDDCHESDFFSLYYTIVVNLDGSVYSGGEIPDRNLYEREFN